MSRHLYGIASGVSNMLSIFFVGRDNWKMFAICALGSIVTALWQINENVERGKW